MVTIWGAVFFFIQSRQELYSGGEPIKAEILPIENAKEKLKKTSGGKALKAIILLIGNVQGWRKYLVVVKQ